MAIHVRNNLGGAGGGTPGGVGGRGAAVQLKNLPEEEQRAFELLAALREMNEPMLRAKVIAAGDGRDPPSAGSLKLIAARYAKLGMPLNATGIARFKADRSLMGGGAAIAGAVAKAYARALDGNEILVRVERAEEQAMRPSERACLGFLREFARKGGGADELKPVKRALGLGNPHFSDAVDSLENEYVGAETVKEISKATTLRSVPLTREGLRALGAALTREAEAAAKKAQPPGKAPAATTEKKK